MKPENSKMPAIIVGVSLLGFYAWGTLILIICFVQPNWIGQADIPKAFSLLDMFIIAAIGLTTGSVGYWLGTTHNSANKDIMLHNSTPSPAPTEPAKTSQEITSTVKTTSVPETEEERLKREQREKETG
jgi:hypothetical protein